MLVPLAAVPKIVKHKLLNNFLDKKLERQPTFGNVNPHHHCFSPIKKSGNSNITKKKEDILVVVDDYLPLHHSKSGFLAKC